MVPAQLAACLGGVAEKLIDLRWTEVSRVNPHQLLPTPSIKANFIYSYAAPFDSAADTGKRAFYELANGVRFSGRQHIVVRLCLLQHQPHALDKIARMPPIALRVEV